MNIETLLHEEIVDEFNTLGKMDVGTDEYRTTVDGLTKLMDRAIEMEKLAADDKEKLEKRKEAKALAAFDQEFKWRQLEEERKDRWIRNVLAAAGIVIPSVITIWGAVKSFEFEKEGTITTAMGRGFINKLLPKSKV